MAARPRAGRTGRRRAGDEPADNPELLDALAKYLVENKYDVRKLIVLITASRVYQTAATPNATNEKDEQNFSRAYFKRPDAEVLLDMICQATGVPEKFPGSPGVDARGATVGQQGPHDFLKLFGRPNRVTRLRVRAHPRAESVSQVLNLLNSPDIQAKLTHEAGTVAKLVRTQKDDAKLVEELYLTLLRTACRRRREGRRREAPDRNTPRTAAPRPKTWPGRC